MATNLAALRAPRAAAGVKHPRRRLVARVAPRVVSFTEAAPPSKTVAVFSIPVQTRYGESVSVVGTFTGWNPASALRLKWSEGNVWRGETELPAGETVEYKYIINSKAGSAVWQPGSNRLLDLSAVPQGTVLVLDDWLGKTHEVQPAASTDTAANAVAELVAQPAAPAPEPAEAEAPAPAEQPEEPASVEEALAALAAEASSTEEDAKPAVPMVEAVRAAVEAAVCEAKAAMEEAKAAVEAKTAALPAYVSGLTGRPAEAFANPLSAFAAAPAVEEAVPAVEEAVSEPETAVEEAEPEPEPEPVAEAVVEEPSAEEEAVAEEEPAVEAAAAVEEPAAEEPVVEEPVAALPELERDVPKAETDPSPPSAATPMIAIITFLALLAGAVKAGAPLWAVVAAVVRQGVDAMLRFFAQVLASLKRG